MVMLDANMILRYLLNDNADMVEIATFDNKLLKLLRN